MKLIKWGFLGMLALITTAKAASFDCAKAQTRIEKFICADSEISKLDEELNTAYKIAVQNQKQADSIRQEQKQWIKERNVCSDTACMKLAYEERLKVLSNTYQSVALLEEKIPSEDGSNIILQCRGSVFNFMINWREPVGKQNERRRHLFYHIFGDFHLLLPVLDKEGRSTGYVNQTKKARALAYEILSKETSDSIPIGVFPAGSDPNTGEWVDGFFPLAQFKKSMSLIGKACNFSPTAPIKSYHDVDKIPPAPVGRGEDSAY